MAIASANAWAGLGSHSPDTDLNGLYPLQETTGTQATDISGNGRHGTIVGMGVWQSIKAEKDKLAGEFAALATLANAMKTAVDGVQVD